MSLESFYGGKQGISPVIKNSFEYIDINDSAYQAALVDGKTAEELLPLTMDLCFENTNYKEVWYDELCIIDTVNKNNPNNGKLFRRTLKNAGDTGEHLCAEYVGRIIGPAGTNPFFSFGNFTFVNDKGKKENIDLAPEMQVSYPIDMEGTTSSAKTTINEQNIEEQIDITPVIQSASLSNNMLVSGKDYNDIQYTWLNVLDDRDTIPTRSIVYLGFQIPFPNLEIYSSTINWNNTTSITKRTGSDYDDRVFHHVWDLTIPRGVRGNAATNIRLTTWENFNIGTSATSSNPKLYSFNDFTPDEVGVYTIKQNPPGPPYPWIESGTVNPTAREQLKGSYIWVYDYTFYDADAYDNLSTIEDKEISKTYTFYLGAYREISNVVFNNDGTLQFHYSDSSVQDYPEMLQWINNIQITNTGKLSFTFNNQKYRLTGDIIVDPNKIYYVQNNSGGYSRVSIDEFTPGVQYYEFTNMYSKQLPYPSDIIVGEDGVITLNLRNNTSLNLQDAGTHQTYKLNYVKSMSVDNATKVLSYQTSAAVNGENPYPLHPLNNGKGINYIEAMTIDEKYHLLAYYASTQYRITQEDITKGWKDNSSKTVTTNGNYAYWDGKTFRKGISGYDNIYWQDFGTMRDVAFGVKVRTTVNYSSHPDQESIDSGTWTPEDFIAVVLNPEYWDNPDDTIENPYYEGAIPGTDEDGVSLRGTFLYVPKINNGSLFFYDYDEETWTYAGSLNDSSQVDAKIQLNDPSVPFNNQELSTYGIALIERTSAISTSLLPDFGV